MTTNTGVNPGTGTNTTGTGTNTTGTGTDTKTQLDDYYGTFDADSYKLNGQIGEVSVARTLFGDPEGQVAKIYLGAVTSAMQNGMRDLTKQQLTAAVLADMQNLSTAVGVVVNIGKTLGSTDKTAGELARA